MSDQTSVNTSDLSIDTSTSVRRPPSAARVLFAILLAVTLMLTVGVAYAGRGAEKAFADHNLKDLPIPVELLLWASRILQNPVWLATAICACVFLGLLTLKGVLDRILKFLIGLNFIWLGLFLLGTVLSWKFVVGILGHGAPKP